MKTRALTSAAIVALLIGAAWAQNPSAYTSGGGGNPWGSTTNQQHMDAVFGAGMWDNPANAAALIGNTGQWDCIFIDGSDSQANALLAALDAGLRAELDSWTAAGGILFINAAPNQGGNQSWPNGVTLLYPGFSSNPSTISAGQAGHPIFNDGTFPAGTQWNGNSFAHASISGGGTALVESSGNVHLAEATTGSGIQLSGGMTTTNFHNPQPGSDNLRRAILNYMLSEHGGGGGGPGAPASSSLTLIITALLMIASGVVVLRRS